jgi:acetyl-CoA synthetase
MEMTMSQSIYPVPEAFKNNALVDNDRYNELYQQSLNDPEGFWGEQAKRLDWFKPFTKVKNTSFDKGHISIKWFEDGELNIS